MFIAFHRASLALLAVVLFQVLLYSPGAYAQNASRTATVTGVIQQSDGSPVAGAPVQLIGTVTLNSQSDASGTFVFLHVPYDTYRVVVNAKGFNNEARMSVDIAGDIHLTVRSQSLSVNGMQIIASVSARQPISITALTPQTLAAQGETTWQHVLNEIPGVNVGLGSGNLSNSLSINQVFPDSPLSAQILQIGGALPSESSASVDSMPISTLTLSSNGPLLGGTGGVDLGVYSPNAFGQATVGIGPGADSPSILNSVGGNLELSPPGYVAKDSAAFSVGSDPYGGINSNATVAFRRGRLSVNINYGVNDSPGPLGNIVNLPFAASNIAAVNGLFFSCAPTPFGSCTSRPYNNTSNPTGYRNNYGAITDQLIVCCAQVSSAWEQHSGSASLFYQVSPTMTAQVFYTGLQSVQGAYEGLFPTTFTPPAGYTGSLSPGVYALGTYPTLSDLSGLQTMSQSSSLLEEKLRLRLGKGELTLAAMQNRTGLFRNENAPESAQRQLWGGGCYQSSTFGACTGPAVFNGGTYTIESRSFGSQNVLQTGYNRDESLEYDRPLGDNYRLKVTYVSSNFENSAGCVLNIFHPALFGGSPFAEDVPTPADAFNLTQDIHLSVGGMVTPKLQVTLSDYLAYLHYHGQLHLFPGIDPTFASTVTEADERFSYQTPRLGIVFHANDNMLIRASAGGAFVAPPIDNYVGSVGLICPFPFGSTTPTYYTENQQNLALKTESSFGFSLGTDIHLERNTTFSLDLYRTALHGQFYSSSNQNGTLNGVPLYVTQTINLGNTRYEGLTAQISHDVSRGWYEQLQFGFTRGYLISVPPGFYDQTPTVCNRTTLAGCVNLSVFPNVNYAGFPYSQGFGKLGYRWSPSRWIDLDATYYGPNNTYYRPAFVVINANAEIPLNKVLSLHATARNITGIYDQAILTSSAFQTPAIGIPQVAGPALWQPGLNYGPRSFVLSVSAHL